ncbi:MAG: hypothetical protein IIA67_06250, partial [Planctomycetes bacterium]|nr:hypothetical protein [Planctomycetota bacterium]
MNDTKLLRQLMVACIVATAAFAPRAAEALAPGTLASHHTQYYYSNSRAPCTTRGVAAVPGACAGTTVISYRPVAASTTYTPRYVPLFGGLSAPWSRPVVAPPAPACGPCQPACPAPPQPKCCNTLRMVPITCYRTVYCRQQVIVHRPVTTYDPCGGCATTVMKPTVTYRMVAQRVPYTAYR